MQEIELKFLVPSVNLKGLMRQAKVKSSQITRLAAHYYDTPDQQLAEAGIGLRIRKEGDAWVQTIKAGGDGIVARLEHNAILDNELVQVMLDTDALMPDLTIYKDTSIAPSLADFKLKKLAKKLTRQYVTDVERTTRLLVENGGDKNSNEKNQEKNSIEVAYDQGEIIHGNDDSRRQPIHEIEFELISGDLDFLFATAKTWCKRYKLCLSTVTKAERGGLLLKEQDYSPAVSADLSQLNVDFDSSMPAFVRAAVHNCLLQILPNSSAIVAGSQSNSHVLQLRIGIERLQMVLNTFNHFSNQINVEWQPILKQTATLLGDYRKLTYLATHIEPKLAQQGAPSVDWTTDVSDISVMPIDAVRANDFQLTLLELIAFVMSNPSIEPQADKPALDKLAKILSKQHTKLLKAAQDFDNANADESSSDNNEEAQHKLHLHLKNLRYLSEFAVPFYHKKGAKKKIKRWLKRLTKAQKAIDKYLNTLYYQQQYQQKSETDSNSLYSAGWFAARLKHNRKRCQKRLTRIQDSATFW